jgi:hypothetical protein
LSLEYFRVFRVNEGDDSELDDTDQDHDDIFLVEVSIDTNVNHEPDDLRYHEDEPNHKETLLEQWLPWLI